MAKAAAKKNVDEIVVRRIVSKESGKYLILAKTINHAVLGEIEANALLRAGANLLVDEGDVISASDVQDLNLVWR